MRHFKPGINNVAVEVVLLTDSDRRCTPGETLNDTNRFVLFDTSSLDLPDFGRIGRYPDLGTMSAGHLPETEQPTTIVMARPHPLQYSAAATLLARMARRSGEPVDAQFGNAPAAGDQSVLFLGAVDQIPSGMLARVKVSENLRSIWPVVTQQNQQTSQAGTGDFTLPAGQLTTERGAGSTDEIRRRWSESFQRPGVLNQAIRSFTEWVEQTFNLSLSSLSLTGRVETPYEPPQRSTLLVAQNYAADGGIWTLVTAQSEQGLVDGVTRLTEPNLWSKLSGRAVALDAQENSVSVQPIDEFKFVQTQPFSILNLRLVAANWMSINIVQYALLLLAGCTFLGAATYLLLKRLGRPS
jgi:hypothetical protein